MRPTVRDLAKAAGVSLATVDRVLNGRAGVTGVTVERVNDAIDRIGFVRNASAATLARGRAYRFLFVLPRQGGGFVGTIKARLAEANVALAAEMVQVEVLEVDAADPHAVARTLSDLGPSDADGITLMVPESPPVRDAILRLRERVPQVVSLVTGHAEMPEMPFIGVDDHRAGATAGRLVGRFLPSAPATALVIGDRPALRNEIDRRQGFDRVLGTDFPHLHVRPTLESRGDPDRTRRILARALSNFGDAAAIYVLSTEAALALDALEAIGAPRGLVVVAHERTPATEKGLREGRVDAIVAQDPGHLARSAIRRMRAGREGRSPIASQEDIRIEVFLPDNL